MTRTHDAPIPIYLYNFPQLTGIAFSADLAARLSSVFPGRIVGMKDSSSDLDYAASITQIDGFDVFPSTETTLARVPANGYFGCISATVNINAPVAAELWANPGNAEALASVTDSRGFIASHPLVPAVKHLVARRLDAPAFARVLPPLLALTDDQQASLGKITP